MTTKVKCKCLRERNNKIKTRGTPKTSSTCCLPLHNLHESLADLSSDLSPGISVSQHGRVNKDQLNLNKAILSRRRTYSQIPHLFLSFSPMSSSQVSASCYKWQKREVQSPLLHQSKCALKWILFQQQKREGKQLKYTIQNRKQPRRSEMSCRRIKSLTQKNMFRLSSIIFSILLFRSLVKIWASKLIIQYEAHNGKRLIGGKALGTEKTEIIQATAAAEAI